MLDQAAKLRQMLNKSTEQEEDGKNSPRIITVASGKGGVGKTNLVCNLAITLAKRGKRVLVFDADLGMANVDVILGVVSRYSLYDVVKGNKTIEEIIINGPQNIKIVPGGTGIQELANMDNLERNRLVESLKNIAKDLDYLFIDTGAGISKNVLSFVTAADDVVIVFTPEPTAITDAYGIIKVISKQDLAKRVYMIANRVENDQEAKNSLDKMEAVAHKFLNFKVKPLGYIYNDKVVNNSVMKQIPFILNSPASSAAKSLTQVAINLEKDSFELPQGTNNFISKLLGFLAK